MKKGKKEEKYEKRFFCFFDDFTSRFFVLSNLFGILSGSFGNRILIIIIFVVVAVSECVSETNVQVCSIWRHRDTH